MLYSVHQDGVTKGIAQIEAQSRAMETQSVVTREWEDEETWRYRQITALTQKSAGEGQEGSNLQESDYEKLIAALKYFHLQRRYVDEGWVPKEFLPAIKRYIAYEANSAASKSSTNPVVTTGLALAAEEKSEFSAQKLKLQSFLRQPVDGQGHGVWFVLHLNDNTSESFFVAVGVTEPQVVYDRLIAIIENPAVIGARGGYSTMFLFAGITALVLTQRSGQGEQRMLIGQLLNRFGFYPEDNREVAQLIKTYCLAPLARAVRPTALSSGLFPPEERAVPSQQPAGHQQSEQKNAPGCHQCTIL